MGKHQFSLNGKFPGQAKSPRLSMQQKVTEATKTFPRGGSPRNLTQTTAWSIRWWQMSRFLPAINGVISLHCCPFLIYSSSNLSRLTLFLSNVSILLKKIFIYIFCLFWVFRVWVFVCLLVFVWFFFILSFQEDFKYPAALTSSDYVSFFSYQNKTRQLNQSPWEEKTATIYLLLHHSSAFNILSKPLC